MTGMRSSNFPRGSAWAWVRRAAIAAVVALQVPDPALAQVQDVLVRNTGVGSGGTVVAPGQVTAFWMLAEQPPGGQLALGSSPFRYRNAAYFRDDQRDPRAAWVSPSSNGVPDDTGIYVYELQFDLTGLDPDSVSISGIFGSDDANGMLWLNEHTGLGVFGNFASPTPFLFEEGFQPGINTLRVAITNELFDPTAFFVEFESATGSVAPVLFGGIHNTAVGSDDTLVAPGAQSSFWTLIQAPGGSLAPRGSAPYRYHHPAYAPDVADAAWVSPTASGNAGPLGDYVYTLEIDLNGFESATAEIRGKFASDDGGAIWINNQVPVLVTSSGQHGFLQDFTINQGFRPGPNQINVRVRNDGDPTAFFVRFVTAVASETPLDCSQGCSQTKYGLGAPDSYMKTAETALAYSHGDFAGSYSYLRIGPYHPTGSPLCGPETDFAPLFGQLILREPTGCIPTSSLACPVEIVSTDPGAPETGSYVFRGRRYTLQSLLGLSLHWNEAFSTPLATDPTATVPVLPGPRGLGLRFLRLDGRTEVRWTGVIAANTQNQSVACCNDNANGNVCSSLLLRTYPLLTPYTLFAPQASRRSDDAAWIFEADGSFHIDEDFTVPGQEVGNCSGNRLIACTSPTAAPLLNSSCSSRGTPYSCCAGPGVGYCGLECGIGTCSLRACSVRVCSDDPTQVCSDHGHCRTPSDPKDLGFCLPTASCIENGQCPAGGTCLPANVCRIDFECPVGGTCKDIVSFGTCDLRERGWRLPTPADDGDPDPRYCNVRPLVLRGTPNRGCSILSYRNDCPELDPPESCLVAPGKRVGHCSDSAPGDGFDATKIACDPNSPPTTDPGPMCDTRSFGPFVRPDTDCDGIEDPTTDTDGDGQPDLAADLCPFHSEIDPFGDTDDDGRGNECECSDQNGDGRVNVSDIVAINQAIFSPVRMTPLCDGNGDYLCNVSDIVAANREIFVPGTSNCSRNPAPQ